MTNDVFCLASNDEDFTTLAECTRRKGHPDHHCDTRKQLAWRSGAADDEGGPIECPMNYDHGRPANRAARRGTVAHPNRAMRRVLR